MAEARVQAVELARAEYRRLLYVGLTRAAERLIVCGVKGVNKIPEGCWYELVSGALKPLSAETQTADGTVWRFRKDGAAQAAVEHQAPPVTVELPAWLSKSAAREKPAYPIVRPSDSDDEDAHGGAGVGRDAALRTGTLVHRLMQSLPDIAPDKRADAARRYLARNGAEFDDRAREAMTSPVLGLLDDPRFAPLFAPGSRAEGRRPA